MRSKIGLLLIASAALAGCSYHQKAGDLADLADLGQGALSRAVHHQLDRGRLGFRELFAVPLRNDEGEIQLPHFDLVFVVFERRRVEQRTRRRLLGQLAIERPSLQIRTDGPLSTPLISSASA